MDLSSEIYSSLHKNGGVHVYRDGAYAEFSVRSCPLKRDCNVHFCRGHIFFLVNTGGRHCVECTEIIARSFPPMNTFLQRHVLAGRLIEKKIITNDVTREYIDNYISRPYAAPACLYCYRDRGLVFDIEAICGQCRRVHGREVDALVRKWMIVGAILGRDVASFVMGLLV